MDTEEGGSSCKPCTQARLHVMWGGEIPLPYPIQYFATPFNLTVDSRNFNTVLYWNYRSTTPTPYFQVETKDKINQAWTVIENCKNILHNYCALSFVTEPFTYYKVRVKALVGDKESNYTSEEFTLTDIGILGPPALTTSIAEKVIVIEIWHPRIDAKKIEQYGEINYNVYFRNTTQRTDDCDDQACSIDIPILDNEEHCFSAEGIIQKLPLKWEISGKTCIALKEEQPPVISDNTAEIAIYTIIPIALVILIVVIGFFLFTKARARMPQSLRSAMPHFHIQPPHSTGYDTVSTYPAESPVEEISCLKEDVKDTDVKKDTDVSHESVSNGSTDPGYHSYKAEENGQKEEEKDGESSNSDDLNANSSNSDSTNCQDNPESDKDENVAKEEPEPSRDLRPINSFGYDKPHCLI
ncbi:interferon gamma receptor 1 isoform X2 [Hyperolius riggenbachi]|uniref:interferon gamma receptor 1 isoform X2 n=1 Tax=Hyperolius riggenbachi TaxID=752182 RepID=UPI0035A36F14